MLDANLQAYWKANGADPDLASEILSEALESLPVSAKQGVRVLQVVRRVGLGPAFAGRVENELEPRVDELRKRLGQIDQIANPETDPQAIVEILGEEAEALDLSRFDAELLRSKRSGAGGTSRRAAAFLDAFGWDNLPAPAREGLRRALDDVREQERFHAQVLLVGADGEGFVLGLTMALTEDGGVVSDEAIDAALETQAKQALDAAFGRSFGARFGLEWKLPFKGASIGLAVVAAGLVARKDVEVDPLTAMTGTVEVDGAVRGVEGIAGKLEAAVESGMRRVLLPEENRAEAEKLDLPDRLELTFVSEVSMLKRVLARVPSGTHLGIEARKTIVRGTAKDFGLEIEDEKELQHGFQFKLSTLDGSASIALYDSGKVVVGGAAGPQARAQDLIDKWLPARNAEPRSPISLQVKSQERQERIEKGLLVRDAEELDPKQHERWRFRVQRGPSAATVVLYASGKVLLQGNAPAWDEAREVLAAELGDLAGADALVEVPDLEKVRERRKHSVEPWIGTDESGKGDFFGPLVSAAVFTDPDLAEILRELGVMDSKKLSDRRVRDLAPKLREILGKGTYVTAINPPRFNSLYSEMRARGQSLNTMLAWGHTRSIENILKRGYRPGYAIVDQFADVRFIDSQLLAETRRTKLEILQFPKAEMDIAVAAASVLAREAFLNWLARASAELGLKLPKGAGPQVIDAGRELVAKVGADDLGKYAKLFFKTTKQVLSGR